MSWLRDWCSLHRLGLALASLAATVVFAVLILAFAPVGYALGLAYVIVVITISCVLRLG